MRQWIAALCCVGLLVTGCSPGGSEPKSAAPQEQQQPLSFDDLLTSKKLSMNTKLESDFPKTWTFQGDEAKAKLEKLIPVLKQGKELPPEGALNSRHNIPMVLFIFDFEGGAKRTINVYNDRFEYGGKWYQLDKAPDQTYGSINEIKTGF